MTEHEADVAFGEAFSEKLEAQHAQRVYWLRGDDEGEAFAVLEAQQAQRTMDDIDREMGTTE